MSSHHVVRENQEPALLIEDYNALSEEHLGQLLEWSPTIITVAHNLDYFVSQAIKVDVLYGNDLNALQEEIKIISPIKSFIEDSLHYLITNQHKSVNILTESLSPIYLEYASKLNIVLFCQGIRYVVVKNRYEKWKSSGSKMHISPSNIKSFNGLSFINGNTFEVDKDGFVSIEMSSSDFVYVGEDF